MMKKITLLILACFITVSLAGCGNKKVEDKANEAVETFSGGDIKDISRLIFGTDELTVNEEIKEFLDSEDNSQEGILSSVFSHSTLSVKKVNKDVVKFEITAPDMGQVLQDLPDNSSDFTENDLKEYIEKYADNTKEKTFSVDVPYTVDGEKIVIDYRNEDFINAITGGLVDAYKQLYMDVLKEYQEGVN